MAVMLGIFGHSGFASSDNHVGNADDDENNDQQYPA